MTDSGGRKSVEEIAQEITGRKECYGKEYSDHKKVCFLCEVKEVLEAERSRAERFKKGLEDVIMHLEGSTCDCGMDLHDIDAADSAREALASDTKGDSK